MTSFPVLWLLILLPSLEANVLRVTLLQVFADSIKVWHLSHRSLHLSENPFYLATSFRCGGTLVF